MVTNRMQTDDSGHFAQKAWLDNPLVRLSARAIGGMVARPIPGQRALLAKRFARRPSGRPLELSDVLAGIASALA